MKTEKKSKRQKELSEKKAAMARRLAQKKQKANPGVSSFIEDTKMEMARVTWPNRTVVTKATILILFIVILSTAMIAGFDIAFSKLFLMLKQ